jgi:hypothetical protein
MAAAHPKIIDAIRPGQMGKRYRVGTFVDERGRVNCHMRTYYNREWDGCVEYDVLAVSGIAAKNAAAAARKRDDADRAACESTGRGEA